jgi:uncharacterized protein YndB with AHSA1/START domain
MEPSVVVSRRVAAGPAEVWARVSDVTRIPEWSPEARAARWVSGEPGAVGARFRGRNRNGRFRWSTSCVVVAAEPGRRFAFDVSYLRMPVARWEYELLPAAGGCEVRESFTDRRGPAMRVIGRFGTGVRDRATHNRRTMERTLEALAAEVEGDRSQR